MDEIESKVIKIMANNLEKMKQTSNLNQICR